MANTNSNDKALAISRASLPNRRDPQNVRAALADRLLLSEALEVVQAMMRGYANGGATASKGYLGALAEVLAQYPRCIAARAAHVMHGVPSECRFLPTPADVIAWCERETKDLRGIVDRDDHYSALERAAAERAQEAERLVEARKTRPTYADLKAKYGENWGLNSTSERDAAADAARTELTEKANRRAFVRECEAAGVDPNDGVSPSLRDLLHPRRTEAA